MSRYIDADAFIKEVVKIQDLRRLSTATIGEALDRTPTADVVEVVRCKDCVYYENFLCGRFSAYGDSVEEPEYDFCSYGERSEDAEKTD